MQNHENHDHGWSKSSFTPAGPVIHKISFTKQKCKIMNIRVSWSQSQSWAINWPSVQVSLLIQSYAINLKICLLISWHSVTAFLSATRISINTCSGWLDGVEYTRNFQNNSCHLLWVDLCNVHDDARSCKSPFQRFGSG